MQQSILCMASLSFVFTSYRSLMFCLIAGREYTVHIPRTVASFLTVGPSIVHFFHELHELPTKGHPSYNQTYTNDIYTHLQLAYVYEIYIGPRPICPKYDQKFW